MEKFSDIKLTQYASKAGCGCKIAPADLEKILSQKEVHSFKNLLVGNQDNDDAAVWDIGNDMAVVNTVDFFMPIVNDAYDFGRIAAANAISDVYAMGAKPLFANAILGWPIDILPIEMAQEVLKGAREICAKAGIPLAGGHSIDSKEPLFGLSVTGSVRTECLKRNNTPKEGDYLFLSKALGTGIMGTAIKRELADTTHANLSIESMCKLNDLGMLLGDLSEVNALTDVTGFGLIGHLLEMCGKDFSADLYWNKVPYFEFLDTYLQQNIIPDNTYKNWNAWENKVEGISDMKPFQVLNDPQTSGGLLISVSEEGIEKVQNLFKEQQIAWLEPIGRIKLRAEKLISVL
ncbi:MAG: selenide, water dikinase SelD [Bacteroidia bacterium]|nr:selenide, water dikinase SelD [Bacteroidia bacterium]